MDITSTRPTQILRCNTHIPVPTENVDFVEDYANVFS